MLIDCHLHVYETKQQGRHHKATYPIVEYGRKDDVPYSAFDGNVDDALEAVRSASADFAIVANLFYTSSVGERGVVEEAPGSFAGQPRAHNLASAKARLVEYNKWICSLAIQYPVLIPLISVDPWVMDPEEMAAHIDDMVSHHGAHGVKLHPKAQRVSARDKRLWPIYRACARLGVPVLAHSGSAEGNAYSEPDTFRSVLDAFPNLNLVLAHLGGGSWRQSFALARDYPDVRFDCSEIVAWLGAPGAPTASELSALIRGIGADRVLFGTDFPWYDIEVTVRQVSSLPELSNNERRLIFGANAASLFGLPTAL